MAQKRKNKSKKSFKWLYWVVIFVLFIAAAVVVYLVWNTYFKKEDKKEPSREAETVQVIEQKTEEVKEEEVQESEEIEKVKEKVKQYEGEDPEELGELTGVVTYAGVSEGELVIRVNIDQFLAEGECELNLVQDGAVLYKTTASVAGMATTATCEGFNIPLAEVSAGEYGIAVKVTAGDKTGVIRGEVGV